MSSDELTAHLVLPTMTAMVEYASITAALAVLVSAIGGTLGLPATNVKGTALVSTLAANQGVRGADARAAYARAPFRRPALRYLYTVGWVSAVKDRASCQAALILGPKPKDAAAQAIRRSPKILARLRGAHLTVSQAATAIGRGTVEGCA